jgi:hypothetical protein
MRQLRRLENRLLSGLEHIHEDDLSYVIEGLDPPGPAPGVDMAAAAAVPVPDLEVAGAEPEGTVTLAPALRRRLGVAGVRAQQELRVRTIAQHAQ